MLIDISGRHMEIDASHPRWELNDEVMLTICERIISRPTSEKLRRMPQH